MEKPPVNHRILIGILAVLYLVGIVGFSIESLRPLFISLTPVHLLVVTGILLISTRPLTPKASVILAGIAISGFLIEVAGVSTGVIFGSYQYGDALGFQLFNVPLLIGINWMTLSLASVTWISTWKVPGWSRPLLATALIVFLDFWMEPISGLLHYWYWADGIIPLQNYVTWAILSIIFTTVLFRFTPTLRNPVAGWWLIFQLVFFVVLNGVI